MKGAVGHTGWVWTRWSCVHTIHCTSIRWHLKKVWFFLWSCMDVRVGL